MGNLNIKTKVIEVIQIKTDRDYSSLFFGLKVIAFSFIVGLVFCATFGADHFTFFSGVTLGGLSSFYYIKYRFYNKSLKVLQKTGLTPLIGLSIYLLWVFSWLIYTDVWSTGIDRLDDIIRPTEGVSDFAVSYAASALDSLIFFILVGFILTIIALKKPEEEKLNRKIEYIFPDVESESDLLPYLVESVSALACINTVAERVLTVTEVSPDNKHLRISLKSHSAIKNIHNNADYANAKMPWGFTVDAQKPDEAILGEIHELSIIDKIGNSTKEKHIIQGIVQLTDTYREHNVTFPMQLSAGQEVIYQANCWVWEAVGNPFSFSIGRYTQHQKISVMNTTDQEISVTVERKNSKKNTSTSNTYALPPITESDDKNTHHVLPIEDKDLTPNDSIILTFIVQE